MALGIAKGGSLLDFNVGLAVAVGLINPLSAQLDALLSIGLGPFQAELAAQLNASLALQASISISIGNPLAALQLAIGALAQIQAALTAALQFPPINIGLSAELTASAAIAATLTARLGLLSVAIQLAIQIKIGAVKAAAELQASLALGPVFAIPFDPGGGSTLASIGADIQGQFASGLSTQPTDPGHPAVIAPGDPVYGVILITSVPAVSAALSAIITV